VCVAVVCVSVYVALADTVEHMMRRY